MRRVVFNHKAGVGKSTIAVPLAAIAAERGRRTLVIDLDRQAHATRYLLRLGSSVKVKESHERALPLIRLRPRIH